MEMEAHSRFKQALSDAVPLILLTVLTLPIMVGYFWLFLSSISVRTEGLIPASGLTLKNWRFLWEGLPYYPSIYRVIGNTLLVAVSLGVADVVISSMAGYALSRLSFPGRRIVLATTLLLHAFPSITLLVGIY
ncbi:MAG: carbohydrate ABC transporter permease, partial [Dehalococcoidales bacterium]|nr:carbohydrate ABC transporter permease [Dehalococcoidales bacterium]